MNQETTTEKITSDGKMTQSSSEVFRDTLDKLNKLGDGGKKVLKQLVEEISEGDPEKQTLLKKLMDSFEEKDHKRIKRNIEIIPPMDDLTTDDETGDAAIEEVDNTIIKVLVTPRIIRKSSFSFVFIL